MTSLSIIGSPRDETGRRVPVLRAKEPSSCGGAPVLDLALCLILAVTVVGLLVLAL